MRVCVCVCAWVVGPWSIVWFNARLSHEVVPACSWVGVWVCGVGFYVYVCECVCVVCV